MNFHGKREPYEKSRNRLIYPGTGFQDRSTATVRIENVNVFRCGFKARLVADISVSRQSLVVTGESARWVAELRVGEA
jgi:hypothetical protein